ncbi:MAG: acyl carrier protein [Pseudomonadota bacterium]
MLTFLEKMIFEKFHEMPLRVRVFTYFVVLFLFVYLMLSPKLIDSRIVFKDQAGGEIPYRGAEVRMHIEGQDYKFMTNELGFVSIPIISRLPEAIEVRVNNVDLDREFPVTFNVLDIWKKGTIKLIMGKSDIHIAANEFGDTAASFVMSALSDLHLLKISIAQAGMLSLPATDTTITPEEKKNIRDSVISTVSATNGVNKESLDDSFPLSGGNAPSYTQRIKIIDSLEKKFGLKIPDEHWKSLSTIGQLIDYIQKRQQLNISLQKQNPKSVPKNWQDIQQSLPPAQRPNYIR